MVVATKIELPAEVSGIRIPDTSLAISITPLWLMHHLLRSHLSAELFGRKLVTKYDKETLYLGAIMQDLGLTDEFAGDQWFELDGADAAKRFLLKHGVPKTRIGLVLSAISLHTCGGIYDRMKP